MWNNQNIISPQCAVQSVGTANQMFVSIIQALLAAHCSISPPEKWPQDFGAIAFERGLEEYDFIIVGAGSGGSVVASRLSENPDWKVLLLEAGGDPPIESEIPGLFQSLANTRVDWNLSSVSEHACKATVDGKCHFPRGKMLGGCSSLNGLNYIRGNKNDYNHWSEYGNNGWNYESVLPYFKKSEGNQYQPFVNFDDGKYHNGSGPLKVDFFGKDELDFYRQIFIAAALERGNEVIADINANKQLGYIFPQATAAFGRRQSAAKAFLIPAKDRPNLHIIKNAFVEKILINSNSVAYGVEFVYKEQHRMSAFAGREVILSAGSYLSPGLLMLSGIGPKNVLKRFNIPVKSDLPVGRNLIDHHCTFVWFKFNPTETSPTQQLDSIYDFAIHNKGPLTGRGVSNLNGFISSVNRTSSPDFQIFVFYYTKNSSDLVSYVSRNKDYIKQKLITENQNHDLAALAVIKLHPLSRGYVEISSSSPTDKPFINANYFSNEDDLNSAVLAIKQQISYINTKSYRKHGGEFIHIPIAECDRHEFQSDDYIRCYIKYFATTNSHPVGTSKMGPDSDSHAVVDSRLKVKNIQNLRQIDAGIMPNTVSGNINSAVIMIAEKGSDMIKQDHGLIP